MSTGEEMSKENKLSKDELVMNLDKMIEDYKNEIGWCEVWEKTIGQIKSLIELSAQELGINLMADKEFKIEAQKLFFRSKKFKCTYDVEVYLSALISKLISYAQAEPSEAGLEELINKYADRLNITKMMEFSKETMASELKDFAKKYDKLRRG